jgi:hypothetical protein
MCALLAALVLLALSAPLRAQGAPPTPPATNTSRHAGGAPARASAAHAATIAAFTHSFEVSLDGVHWAKAITQPFPYRCELGGTTLCGPRTPDVRVYTRWTPLPAVNMAQVHIKGMAGPYRIDVSSPRVQSVCEVGASYPLPSSGFPITIRASRPGGPFPITCTWVVAAVVARPPGSTPVFELVRSNAATVTLTMRE